MFVPLRYKLDIGSSRRVRVLETQQMAVPGAGFGARNQTIAPSETQVALMGTRVKARRGDTCHGVGVAEREAVLKPEECHE